MVVRFVSSIPQHLRFDVKTSIRRRCRHSLILLTLAITRPQEGFSHRRYLQVAALVNGIDRGHLLRLSQCSRVDVRDAQVPRQHSFFIRPIHKRKGKGPEDHRRVLCFDAGVPLSGYGEGREVASSTGAGGREPSPNSFRRCSRVDLSKKLAPGS